MKKFLTTSLILILIAVTVISGVFIIRDVVSANANIEQPVDPGGEDPGGEDPTDPVDPGGEDPDEPIDPTPIIDVWDGTKDISWYNTTDTEFTLTTPEQLASLTDLRFSNKVNEYRDITIKLGADMYLNYGDSNNYWQPIGRTDWGFSCTFDGQNHTIYGLKVYNTELKINPTYGIGLFGEISGANIFNLIIDGAEINQSGMSDPGREDLISGTRSAGVLVGYADSNVEINNITIKNSTVKGDKYSYVGGLAGYCDLQKNITEIKVENTALSGNYVGGIFGYIRTIERISLNNLNVDVSASGNIVTGIVAQCYNGKLFTIENANVVMNATAETFSNFIYNKDPIKTNPLIAVIIDSNISGNVKTETYYEYDGILSKEDNVVNNLNINGVDIVEDYILKGAKFFKGIYVYYNPSVGLTPMYELIVTEDKAIINEVKTDSTGFPGVIVKHVKDYEIKSASHDSTVYFLKLESEDGETITFRYDISKDFNPLSTYNGDIGYLKLTAAA